MNKHVVANIQNYRMLDGGKVASVVASTAKVETAADYAARIKQDFGGKLEVVPMSVRDITNHAALPAVAFHVRAVTESQPYTEEAAASMRTVITANVFADAEDATWEVVEAAGVKRLVKRTDTDITALLAASASSNYARVAASNYEVAQAVISQGDYALFTNPETASVDFGHVIFGDNGALHIVSRSSGNMIPCGRDAIIASAAYNIEYEQGEERLDETAALDRSDVQRALAYFRQLYASQPAFFSQLEAAIRKRFLVA